MQTKTPLLTIDSVLDAEKRGQHVACEVHDSMGVSNGTTALGIAVALGEIKMPKAEEICKNLDLYSSVASCSSGVELTQAQIVLLGNKPGAGGRYRIGHAVMKDALDIDGIYDAIRNAGLELPERPRAEDLGGRVVNCFMKCEADRRGTLRGRRQIMLDDSDVHHHRHSKARGRRRRRRGDRRSGRVRFGRRHAPGPARRRPGDRHRRSSGNEAIAQAHDVRHSNLLEPARQCLPRLGETMERVACNEVRTSDRWRALPGAVAAADGRRWRLPAAAQDKVKVGVFPVSSSLPYFVALERGFFKEQNIEPETIRLIGGPPNVAGHDHQPDRRCRRCW